MSLTMSLRSSFLACLAFALLGTACGVGNRLGSGCSASADCNGGLVCATDCVGCASSCRVSCTPDGGQCTQSQSCQPLLSGGPLVCSY